MQLSGGFPPIYIGLPLAPPGLPPTPPGLRFSFLLLWFSLSLDPDLAIDGGLEKA